MFKLFYFFSSIILFVIQPEVRGEFDYEYNFFLSLYYFFILLTFFLEQRLKDDNWLRFDVIFLIGYTIVHFQIPFLASLGFEPLNPSFIWINKDVVNYATWMSLLAITLWIFGYSLISKKVVSKDNFINFNVKYKFHDFLLIVFFLGFISTVGKNFLSGAYNVNSWGGAATYFLLILKILIYLRIIYFFKDLNGENSLKVILKNIYSNKVFLSILLIYVFLFFLTGSRGEILRISLIVAFCYSIFIRKLSLNFILSSIILGSIIFTIMGLGRGREANDLGSGNILERGYSQLQEKEGDINFTEELASSIRIQYRAIDTIPYSYDYLYGLTYLPTIIGAIPFASGYVVKTFNIPDAYLDSANFFTYLGQGNNVTFGEGSEILADVYINFGKWGVFIVMFVFGLLSAKVSNEAKRKNIKFILVYAILLISALAVNRGTILYFYKDILYIIFLHYLLSGKLKWIR